MSDKPKASLWRLALGNLLIYTIDMACAFGGFTLGFGLKVENWWAVIGFMILSRWTISLVHGAYRIRSERTTK